MNRYTIRADLLEEFPSRADAENFLADLADGISPAALAALYEAADANPDWTTGELHRYLAVEQDVTQAGPDTLAWLLIQSGR
jgi:hypothetical protein